MGAKSSVDLESRRQSLTDLLSVDGTLRIEELADRFGVSTMTIRRDLQALEDHGVVRRVRGGAVRGAEPFVAREGRAGAAKQIIARKLVGLVPAGGVGICMDASSTISVLAGSLPHSENLSVVTDGVETDDDDPDLTVTLSALPPLGARGSDEHPLMAPDGTVLTRREHKRRLRDANAELARSLVHRTGWGHAKVNAELNRLAGISRITEATVEQLERRIRQGEHWYTRLATGGPTRRRS